MSSHVGLKIDLESFDPDDPKQIVNSPRSLEALAACGLEPQQLFRKPESWFISKFGNSVGKERFKRFEMRRQEYVAEVVECRTMLISMIADNQAVAEGIEASSTMSKPSSQTLSSQRPSRPTAIDRSPVRMRPRTATSISNATSNLSTTTQTVSYNNRPATACPPSVVFSVRSPRDASPVKTDAASTVTNVELLVDPLAREQHRVAVLARNKQKAEQARLRRALEDELLAMQSMAVRAEEEARRRQVAAEEERRNVERQAAIRRSMIQKEEKERALALVRSGKVDVVPVIQNLTANSDPENADSGAGAAANSGMGLGVATEDRHVRAQQVMLAKEALMVLREGQLRADDRQRQELIAQRLAAEERRRRRRGQKRDAAIESAAHHLERLEREKALAEVEKMRRREEAAMRAEERVEVVKMYFREHVSQRMRDAQERREREEREREERIQRERAREEAREQAIERRRAEMRRSAELARMNKTDTSKFRAMVYERAEELRREKERGVWDKLSESEQRSEAARERQRKLAWERQQRQQMLLEEQREHVARVERMDAYRRRKVEERLQFEAQRVQWLEGEKQRLRQTLRSGAPGIVTSPENEDAWENDEAENPDGQSRRGPAPASVCVPEHVRAAAVRVSQRLGVSLSEAMKIAKQMIQQQQQEGVPASTSTSTSTSTSVPARPQTASGRSRPPTRHSTSTAAARGPPSAATRVQAGTGASQSHVTRPASAAAPRLSTAATGGRCQGREKADSRSRRGFSEYKPPAAGPQAGRRARDRVDLLTDHRTHELSQSIIRKFTGTGTGLGGETEEMRVGHGGYPQAPENDVRNAQIHHNISGRPLSAHPSSASPPPAGSRSDWSQPPAPSAYFDTYSRPTHARAAGASAGTRPVIPPLPLDASTPPAARRADPQAPHASDTGASPAAASGGAHVLHDPAQPSRTVAASLATQAHAQAQMQALQRQQGAQMLELLEEEHQRELQRQEILRSAAEAEQPKLEVMFAGERARAAATLQNTQRKQRLELASLAEALGVEHVGR